MLAVRLWELGFLAVWTGGLWWILTNGRNSMLLGIYAGASATVFWDWISGSGWLFNIPTYDHRFVHLFTIGGRMEPVWVLFAQGAFFGLPAILALRFGANWLNHRLSWLLYLGLGVGFGVADFALVERISIDWLHLYHYYYKPSHLNGGVPYEVALIYVPVCIVVLLLLMERVVRLLELADLQRPTECPAPPSIGRSSDVVSDANLSLEGLRVRTIVPVDEPKPSARDRRIGFWLGAAIPPVALYAGAIALAFFNEITDPLLRLPR